MPRKKNRTTSCSPYSKEAVLLLGKQIRLARIQHAWPEKELAERACISRETVQRAEKGSLSCAIGTVFELAFLVGVTLFDSDLETIQRQRTGADRQLALLPSRIRQTGKNFVPDDDF